MDTTKMKQLMNTNIEIRGHYPPIGIVIFLVGVVALFIISPALSLLGVPMIVTIVEILISFGMIACVWWVD